MQHEGIQLSESDQDIEVLRGILELEQLRPVTYDEAVSIAHSLLEFYEVLAQQGVSDV